MNDPNLRIAGQLQRTLHAGSSIETFVLPDFATALKSALQTTDGNQPTQIRLMFEVEQ